MEDHGAPNPFFFKISQMHYSQPLGPMTSFRVYECLFLFLLKTMNSLIFDFGDALITLSAIHEPCHKES